MDTPKIKIEGIFTMRELYAAFALAGLASFNTSTVVEQAWRVADAMVEEARKREETADPAQEIMQFMNERKTI